MKKYEGLYNFVNSNDLNNHNVTESKDFNDVLYFIWTKLKSECGINSFYVSWNKKIEINITEEFDLVISFFNSNKYVFLIIEVKRMKYMSNTSIKQSQKIYRARFENKLNSLKQFIEEDCIQNKMIEIVPILACILPEKISLDSFSNNKKWFSVDNFNLVIKNHCISVNVDLDEIMFFKKKNSLIVDDIITNLIVAENSETFYYQRINLDLRTLVDVICNSIDNVSNKKNCYIINGAAGTGKSILGLLLFFFFAKNYINYNDSSKEVFYFWVNYNLVEHTKKLLISISKKYSKNEKIKKIINYMLSHFINRTLDLKDKVFSSVDKKIIVIIDEYQRLSYDKFSYNGNLLGISLSKTDLETMFKNYDVIMLGDTNQRLNPKDENFYSAQNIKKIDEILKSKEINYKTLVLYKQKRLNNNFYELFAKILSFKIKFDKNILIPNNFIKNENSKKEYEYFLKNLNFNLYYDKNEFFDAFDNSSDGLFCLPNLDYFDEKDSNYEYIIYDKKLSKLKDYQSDDKSDIFYDIERRKQFIFTSYDLLSQEINDLFIYIPENINIKELEKSLDSTCNNIDIEKQTNALYTAFSRPINSINIWINEKFSNANNYYSRIYNIFSQIIKNNPTSK